MEDDEQSTVSTEPGNMFAYGPGGDQEWEDEESMNNNNHNGDDNKGPSKTSSDLRDIFSDSDIGDDDDNDDDYMADFDDEDEEDPRKPRKSKGGNEHPLSHEVAMLLSEGTRAFTDMDYSTAIDLAEAAVQEDKNAKQAYTLLAAIHEELGNAEKVRLAKAAAMYLDKRNKDGWIEIAQMSQETGHLYDALEFYTQAANVDNKDAEILDGKVTILEQIGDLQKAVEVLRKVRKLKPTDAEVLIRMAHNLTELNKTAEAVSLYEDLLDRNRDPYFDRRTLQEFGFSELNVLIELYFGQRAWIKSIKTIKRVSRWILDRGEETFWDEVKDDSEFDSRRFRNKRLEKFASFENPEKFSIPIDIRVKLLLCRLRLGDSEEALVHLGFLKDLSAEEYGDLYLQVGKALQQSGLYSEALELFLLLDNASEYSDLSLMARIGKCEFETGEIEQAERTYKVVLEHDPNNIETMIALAEIFGATGRLDEAKELIEDVDQLREEQNEDGNDEDSIINRQGVQEADDTSSIIAVDSRPRNKTMISAEKRKHRRLTPAEKLAQEHKATATVEDTYSQLLRYQAGMEAGNPVAVSEWLRLSQKLIDMFTSIKKFFPTDRNKVFTGIETKRRRRGALNIDERLEQIQSRIDEAQLEEETSTNQQQDSFRGLGFATWFDLFMRYSLCLTFFGDPEGAYSALRRAKAANVFYQDTEKDEVMSRVFLACAYHSKDYKTANEIIRQYGNAHQFNNDVFRLYGVMLSSGAKAAEFFSSNNNQKYVLRQVKALDSVIHDKTITGAARIIDKETQPEKKENPLLVTLYAHIMLVGKSFVPALNYLSRAHSVAPKDTIILLSIGIAHIHRAIQRQTTNRHLQVVQGLSYLMQYYDLRTKQGLGETMEANYNLGRTFHMLGLPSLAVTYYDHVLEVPDSDVDPIYDFRYETSYNLHLIYTVSGNARLARDIIDKHIVI